MKRFGRRLLWITCSGGLGVIVFVMSFYIAMKVEMRSSEVSVPDLAGMTQDEAGRLMRPLELFVEVVDQRHDPSISSGRILQQEPAAGASVRRGRKVKIVTSLGGEVLEVPALESEGARAAEIELRRKGFAPGGETRIWASGSRAGAILAQVPPPGSPAIPGTRVYLLVSEGPPARRWVMPDLTGRSREVVENWIDLRGFRKGPVRQVPSSDPRSGIVLGQHPLAGYPITPHDVVELTVTK